MTRIGQFLESIAHSPRLKAALAAAGVLSVLVAAQTATAQDALVSHRQVKVDDVYEAGAINERVNDQLSQLKLMSDALGHSYGFSSPNVEDRQKAANIKLAYEFAMRNISHPELAETDAYFLAPERSAELAELVDAVNRKKNTLLKATYFLQQVQQAYVYGREDLAQEYTEKLAEVADQIEEAIMHDISSPVIDDEIHPQQAVDGDHGGRVDLTIERQRIEVGIDRPMTDVQM
jgi:hypothetical protein